MKENASEYGWTEEVLADATMFVPQELPRPVPYFKKPWHCFENSFEHARKTGLLYVEGLAINPTGPQIHAWNSTDGTDVIDLTWPFQHVNKYFGLVFDVEKLTMAGYPFGAYFGHLYDRLKKQRAQSGQV